MRSSIFIALTLISNLIFGQETGTFQSDSVYKANKVKARLWFSGTNKILSITTFYDTDGRLIKYQLEPFMDGVQRTTQYSYDLKGRLTAIVDTTRNGEPNKEQIERLKKMGVDPSTIAKKDNNKSRLEIAKYELTYSGDQLIKVVEYNPDGSLHIVDNIENNGKRMIRDWYRNGKQARQSTSEYLTEFHKEKYYGWDILNGKKSEWSYSYKYQFEGGRIKSFVRYEGNKELETTKYFYDDKGLLIKVVGYVPEFFEYVYY